MLALWPGNEAAFFLDIMTSVIVCTNCEHKPWDKGHQRQLMRYEGLEGCPISQEGISTTTHCNWVLRGKEALKNQG